MKILKRLLNRAGETTISTAQKLGLAAAVGVAGLAAGYMFMSGPEKEANTVFSAKNAQTDSAANAGPEIVYVGGGSTAGSVGYTNPVENTDSVLYAKRAGKKYNFNFIEDPAEQSGPRPDLQEQEAGIYKMDGTSERLLVNNQAEEKSMDDSGAMNNAQTAGKIADIQGQIAQMAAQAQAGAANPLAGAQQAAAAAGAGQTAVGGMASASGNAFGSTPLQAGEGRGGVLNSDAGAAGAGASGGIAGVTAKFEGGRNSVTTSGQRYRMSGDSAKDISKNAKGVAANANRSVNEGAQIFLNAERHAGGIRVEGFGNLETLGSSAGYDDSDDNLPETIAGVFDTSLTGYWGDRKALHDSMKKYVDAFNKMSLWSLFADPAIRTIVIYAGMAGEHKKAQDEIKEFKEKYGKKERKGPDGKTYSDKILAELDNAYWKMIWPDQPKKDWEKYENEISGSTRVVSSSTETNTKEDQ